MTKLLRKFKFSDINLAKKTRGNMWSALKSFDANQNQKFDQDQIRQALKTILKQDENQVQYVVKNVFRYDKDNDGAITYSQFTNFSVQQHFGQMAIQRLHKKGYYTNGARRIMNLEEFETTLNYSLDFISSKGTHIQYERLFNEVDLDNDGMISYQDYFVFLREYFGSLSQAYDDQIKNDGKPIVRPPSPPPLPPAPQIDFIDGNGQSPQERFAKLIYSQFKITVMQRDRNKNLILEREQFQDILQNVFRLSYNEQIQLEDKFIGGSNTSKYDDFMRAVVTTYMSQVSAKRFFQSQFINQDQFVNTIINKVCQFVTVKPAQHVLRACFRGGSRGKQSISVGDYTNMMKSIFQTFRFDTRGLPVSRPKSQKFDFMVPKSYY